MVNCNQCKTPEDCLRSGECDRESSDLLDNYMQNNEFDFEEEKEEPSNCKYECD